MSIYHLGPRPPTTHEYERAARQAQKRGAYEEAAQYFERARETARENDRKRRGEMQGWADGMLRKGQIYGRR